MIKSQYKKLISSKVFKDWEQNNKNYYLSSYVLINEIPQFDFYNPKIDKITSFILNKTVEITKDQNIFKKSKDKIQKLNLEKIKITLKKAFNIINSLKKYKNIKFTKKIVILQNIKIPLWNISLITSNFNILNIKINAVNGNIISENYESLLNFKV